MHAYTNNRVQRVYSLSSMPCRPEGASGMLSMLAGRWCTFLSHIMVLRLPCGRRPDLYHFIDKAGPFRHRHTRIGRSLRGFQLRQKHGERMQVLVGQTGYIGRPLSWAMVQRLRPVGCFRLMQEGDEIIQSVPGADAVQVDAVVGAVTHSAVTAGAAQIAKTFRPAKPFRREVKMRGDRVHLLTGVFAIDLHGNEA